MLRRLTAGVVGLAMLAAVAVGTPEPVRAGEGRLDEGTEALLRRLAADCGWKPEVTDELLELARAGGLDVSDDQAAELLSFWYDDPARFWREALSGEPDGWQAKVCDAVARDPRGRVAMKACKGPGKSTVLAVIIWWFLATRPHANVVAVSITADNLRDGLWKELAKWYARSPLLQRMFSMSGEIIALREAPKTWWCHARAFARTADAEAQASTLAGLHGEHVLIVLDEVSDYPAGVLPAARAAFSVEGQEIKLVVAGNPTRQAGPLWDVCTRDAAQWWTISITGDPLRKDRAPRISIAWAEQEIRTWGRENPHVMTNVLGEFPNVQSDKLIGPEDVIRAEQRGARREEFEDQPKILGVDVARKGSARTVVYMRQGCMVWRPETWRSKRTDETVDLLARLIEKHAPDGVFIDAGTFGIAVTDQLRRLGFDFVHGIDFAGKPAEERFGNKRAEMWWSSLHAIRDWLCLPPGGGTLQSEVCEPCFSYREVGGKTRFYLEGKDELEERGVPSPDEGDALALTFARPVVKRKVHPFAKLAQERRRAEQDYQPNIG